MKLYIGNAGYMTDLCGIELLEGNRRNRLMRYRKIEDRARCLTAGLMLRSVLGDEAAREIKLSEFGKPFLPGGPCFSLSHSGKLAVLLADARDVGVDVEYIRPFPEKVVKRVFTENEQDWFRRNQTDEAFFRLWTGKEAVMKAAGLGFGIPPKSFEVRPDSPTAVSVCGCEWYLHWFELDGHLICTAAENPDKPESPVLLTRSELIRL